MSKKTAVQPTDPDVQKKKAFRKFYYRGIEVDKLLELSQSEFFKLLHSRARRRFIRRLRPQHYNFIMKLRKVRKQTEASKPKDTNNIDTSKIVKTHLRNMLVLPEMIGTNIGVHVGNKYALVEVKPDMIGHYLGEFGVTYVPTRHGRPGVGATNSSRFIPLK